jgi:peptide subunit release factor RF-3
VKCILGAFYGNNPVTSDVKVNKAMTIDGHDGWVVESQLSFDIPGLKAKGELLIVAIVTAKDSSGLYYASIPDNAPELIPPARQSLAHLKVDG